MLIETADEIKNPWLALQCMPSPTCWIKEGACSRRQECLNEGRLTQTKREVAGKQQRECLLNKIQFHRYHLLQDNNIAYRTTNQYQSATMSAKPKRVCLLALDKTSKLDQQDYIMKALNAKADVSKLDDPAEITSLFTSTTRVPILALDHGLSATEHAPLLAQAVTFVKNGGTLIFAANFSPSSDHSAIEEIFDSAMEKIFDAFSLPWKFSESEPARFHLNPEFDHPEIDLQDLAESYSVKAVNIRHVNDRDTMYKGLAVNRTWYRQQTPVAFGKVGEGRVGYVSNLGEDENTAHVLMRLCGLKYSPVIDLTEDSE